MHSPFIWNDKRWFYSQGGETNSLIIESSLKDFKRYISEFSTESTECQCHCADHYDCYYSDHCYTEPALNELLHFLRDTVSSGVSLECQFFTFVGVHVHAKKTCY